jgi:hypothetical protein
VLGRSSRHEQEEEALSDPLVLEPMLAPRSSILQMKMVDIYETTRNAVEPSNRDDLARSPALQPASWNEAMGLPKDASGRSCCGYKVTGRRGLPPNAPTVNPSAH